MCGYHKPHHLVALFLGLSQSFHGKFLSGGCTRSTPRFQKLGLLSSHHGLKFLKPCIPRMLKNAPSEAASLLSAAQTQCCRFGEPCFELLQELMARLKEGNISELSVLPQNSYISAGEKLKLPSLSPLQLCLCSLAA